MTNSLILWWISLELVPDRPSLLERRRNRDPDPCNCYGTSKYNSVQRLQNCLQQARQANVLVHGYYVKPVARPLLHGSSGQGSTCQVSTGPDWFVEFFLPLSALLFLNLNDPLLRVSVEISRQETDSCTSSQWLLGTACGGARRTLESPWHGARTFAITTTTHPLALSSHPLCTLFALSPVPALAMDARYVLS